MKNCECQCGNQSDGWQFYIQLLSPMVAVFTALMTIAGGIYAYNHQANTLRHERFLSEAHKVSDDVTILLFDGLKSLRDLNESADNAKEWTVFFDKKYVPYLEAKEKWRRDMIIMHYRVERYFGADIAAKLIDTEMLIAGIEPDDLSKPSPCSMREDARKSLMITNEAIECEVRGAAAALLYSQVRAGGVSEGMIQNNELSTHNYANLRIYDRQIVQYIKEINQRLTGLGEVSVKVMVN